MSSEPLGLEALGEIVDLLDTLRTSTAGIYIVVTDRPDAVRAALEARLPAGCALHPLANAVRDGLDPGVYTPPAAPAAHVFVAAMDPRDPTERKLLTALNVEREWLMAPQNHAVLLITGRTLEDADDAYLALQRQAPDLWSLRSSVYRAGGPASDARTRAQLRERVAERLGSDRAAGELMAPADLSGPWETHRLWRGPERVDAWLAESPAPSVPRIPAGELIRARGHSAPFFSLAPMGEPVPRDSLPVPAWPSGRLDAQGQLLVDAAAERLDSHGHVRIHALPDSDEADFLAECALTVALLRASRYHAVVHLDLRHGLAGAIHTWLAAADPTHEPSATHGQALQRLAGALHGHRTLIVLTHADATSVDLARAALREHAMVAAVQPRIRAAFAVCHHIDRSDWGAWAADQLKPWPLGAFATAWTSGPSLVLALRQALAMARSVIVFGGKAQGAPGAWAVAERARDRIAALLIDDAVIPHGAEALSWTRLSPDDEQAARGQLWQAAENLAGPRPPWLTRLDDIKPGRAPFPGAPVIASPAETPAPVDPDLLRPMLGGLLYAGVATLPERPTPAQYLNPGLEVVPFANRRDELAALHAWAESAQPVSVQLVYGCGGEGKTRLAIEWIRQRRERGDVAGFLDGEITPEVIDSLMQSEGAMIVIDNAETRAGLGELVRSLARRAVDDPSPRLRVMLLARSAGDWWRALIEREGNTALPARAMHLGPLVPASARAAEFARAAAHMARAAGSHELPAVPDELGAPRFASVLDLHAAAVAMVHGASASGALLDREIHALLGRVTPGDPGSRASFRFAIESALAAITLRGGVGSIEQLDDVLAHVAPGHASELARLFVENYAQPSGSVAGLHPDSLGEALVLRVLGDERTSPDYLERVLEGTDHRACVAVFTMLGRISVVHGEEMRPWLERALAHDLSGRAQAALEASLAADKVSAFSLLGPVLAENLHRDGSADIARSLLPMLPEHTVSLRILAVWVYETLLHALPDREDTRVVRTRLLNDLGIAYGEMGNRAEALSISEEAMEIVRKLEEERPEVHLPDLARGLTNLGIAYNAMSMREEALLVSEEAVDIYRKLAKERPETYLPYLARSLNNLGNRFRAMGKEQEALEMSEEAMEIVRKLAKERPETYLPYLAMNLNNRGIQYSETGKEQEALEVSEEAMAIYRKLAEERPEAYLPDLAMSLLNLGVYYNIGGNREKALEVSEEAVDVYRKLAGVQPGAFLPGLASSLLILGHAHNGMARRAEALAAATEAVAIFNELIPELPAVYWQEWIMSVASLTSYLKQLGGEPGSDATYQAAVEILASLQDGGQAEDEPG